jgi:hypothetical protein
LDSRSDAEERVVMDKINLNDPLYPRDHYHNTFFGKIKHNWNLFDNNYIKPYLLNNWPQSKIDHEEITIKIKKMFSEHKKVKNMHRSQTVPLYDRQEISDKELEEIDVLVHTDNIILDDEENQLRENYRNKNN